jgi:GNAT superfamily N-acetyltransferase
MSDVTMVLTDAPSEAAQRVITEGLDDYNAAQAGYRDWRPLAVLVHEKDERVVGGMLGRTSLGLLFVNLVYLPEGVRSRRIGSEMLRMIEEEAVRRGCRSGILMTISFQAPGFYERHGWRELGRVECEPVGTHRIVMTKSFVAAQRSRVARECEHA